MTPPMGRPKSDNPMDVDLKVRVDRETNKKLLAYCEKHGITKAEAVRKGIHLILAEEKE